MKISLNKLVVILQTVVIVGLILGFFHYCNKQEKETDRKENNHNFELTKTRNKLNQEITRANVYKGSLSELRKDSSKQLQRLQAIEKEYGRKLQTATALTIRAHENVSGKTEYIPGDTVRKDSLIYVYPKYRSKIITKYSNYRMFMSRDSSNIVADMIIPLDIANVKAGKRPRPFAPRPLVIDVKLINPATETESLTSFSKAGPKQNRLLKAAVLFLGGFATAGFMFK